MRDNPSHRVTLWGINVSGWEHNVYYRGNSNEEIEQYVNWV